jgi:hypothetical protein
MSRLQAKKIVGLRSVQGRKGGGCCVDALLRSAR